MHAGRLVVFSLSAFATACASPTALEASVLANDRTLSRVARS